MTPTQRNIIVMLATTYAELGRARHALFLLLALGEDDADDATVQRLRARCLVDLGDYGRALALIEALVDRAATPRDLARLLSLRARALSGLGRGDAARDIWVACFATCRANGLDIMEFAS
ncbi:tetratricopeptide repeat protein [Roseobacter weihaiensis]|uniref:hypothetical protein n=1 Tax=Roseobacter weihaiensis TaxID=2763262 RepID=UPI0029CAC500|nr:hypothetical protein [Roseobacter sp. H9]